MLNPANIDREAVREEVEDGDWNEDGKFLTSQRRKTSGPWGYPQVLLDLPYLSCLEWPLSLWHGDATSALVGIWPPVCSTTVGWPPKPTGTRGNNIERQVIPASSIQSSLCPPASHTAQWDEVKVWDFLDDKITDVLSKTLHSHSVPTQWSIWAVQERQKDDEHCQSGGVIWEDF